MGIAHASARVDYTESFNEEFRLGSLACSRAVFELCGLEAEMNEDSTHRAPRILRGVERVSGIPANNCAQVLSFLLTWLSETQSVLS